MTDLVYLVELTVYDPAISGTRVLRYCSGRGFATRPSETPANTYYEPGVLQPINFERAAFSRARVMGQGSAGYGVIELANADDALSGLLDYGFDGRSAVVRVGVEGAAYPSGYTTFLSGTMAGVEADATSIKISLRDLTEILDNPIQETLYAGTNSLPSGKEGTADDIKGQVKPLCYGRCYEVAPIQVNTAKLIYQVHDGAIQAIDGVYDNGYAITYGTNRANLAAMEATAPSAGYYDTCLAEGLIRINETPAGRITADVRGDATGSYVNTVGSIVKRILTTKCGVSSGDIDDTSFTALDSAAGYDCGIYIAQDRSRQDVLNELLLSVGAWLAPSRLGVWQVGRLIAPSGTPAASFVDDDIISITREATQDEDRGVPVYRVAVRYKRLWSTYSEQDILGGVDAARKAFLLSEYRTSTADDTSVRTKHLLSPKLERDTLLISSTDADAEAARLLALHKVRRDYVTVTVAIDETLVALDIGSIVQVTTSMFDYDAGRLFYVVGIETDGRAKNLTLQLWG